MTIMPIGEPGDVYAIRTGGKAAGLIRFGSGLLGKPNLSNHIAVVHHVTGSTKWAIEGKPGGVGWVDCARYAQSPYLLTNVEQPKTSVQRSLICATLEGMLGTPYDWPGIAQDALADLHLPDLWAEKWGGVTPGHVVCSSLAAWAYAKGGCAAPKTADMAHIQPSDWDEFILTKAWELAA